MSSELNPTQTTARTPAPPRAHDAALAEYATLKARVREALIVGQQRIEAAKVITYWRTGWYIQTHIALHTTRAERYGMRVIERLARDLDMDESVLLRCLHFAQRLPDLFNSTEIPAARQESFPSTGLMDGRGRPLLTWTHYRTLIAVSNPRQRETLLQQAARQEWPVAELEARIRREAARSNTDGTQPPRLLTPLRGTPGLFQIKELLGVRYWDLGFESYRALTTAQAQRLKAGDVVRLVEKKGDGSLLSQTELMRTVPGLSAQLYTYEARVVRVVDGDTLWLLIRLCGADWRKEKLRLRGMDCPELGTPAGDAAKRYVQAQVARAARVVITTTKPDKWDRYLSDVFLITATGEEVFLNNRLLDTGHARLYDANSPKDWEGA